MSALIRETVARAQEAAGRLSEAQDTDALRAVVDAMWHAGWAVKKATWELDYDRAEERAGRIPARAA
jgi:hypothetical protein